LVRSGISNAFASRGLSPQDKIAFPERLDIQIDLLELQETAFIKAGDMFVTDRTPLDLIAYTLAEINGDAARQLQNSKQLSDKLSAYIERCYSVTRNNFDKIIIVSDLAFLVPDSTKGASSQFYCDKIRTLINESIIKFKNKPIWLVNHMCVTRTDLGDRLANLNAVTGEIC
jgi:hypothetical protein